MDCERIMKVLQAMASDIRELIWIDAALNNGGGVELTLYDNQESEMRRIQVNGEILQDNLLKELRENREEALTISMDELNSLIKEDEKV